MATLEDQLEGMLAQSLAHGPTPEAAGAALTAGFRQWRPWAMEVDGAWRDRYGRPREAFVVSDASLDTQERRVGPPGGDGLSPRDAFRTHGVRGALAGLGVPSEMVATLTQAALACATASTPQESTNTVAAASAGHARDNTAGDNTAELNAAEAGAARVAKRGQALVGVVETLTRSVAQLEGVVLSSVSELTGVTGATLLADKGVSDVEELTRAQREKFRGRAKRLTAAELEAAIGWGAGEAMDLVAVANLPVAVRAPVSRALEVGEAPWRLVRRFFRESSEVDTADAATIAAALFGSDPDNAVPERLTSDGEFSGHMWRHKEFYRALSREVRKLKAKEPEPERRSRERNLAANDVRVNLDEFGTACVMIGCTAAQGAAIANRIARASRAARAGGDPRTLQQLRTALGLSLLLHGTLEMAGLPDDPDLITPDQSAELAKILNGLPAAQLEVIVPLNTLLGATPAGMTPTLDAAGLAPDGATPASRIPAAFGGTAGDHSLLDASAGASGQRPGECTCACTCGAREPGSNPPQGPPDTSHAEDAASTAQDRPDAGPTGEDCPGPGSTGPDCPGPGSTAPDCPDRDLTGEPCPVQEGPEHGHGVGEVIGALSVFLSPDEVRTLALTPGSTMYRLVTDPVTGALIERSTKAYAFDGALRAHIISADVFCRMPGCLRPASTAQIDHVQEFGTPGGHTCLANGQPLDPVHHDFKTKKLWDADLAANRDVTWTSLLGLIYVTKAHDYTQYTRLYQSAVSDIEAAVAAGEDRSAMVDRAIYEALCFRPPGARLAGEDDTPLQDERFTGWDLITLTYTAVGGKRIYMPSPDASRAESRRFQDVRDEAQDSGGSDDSEGPDKEGPDKEGPGDDGPDDDGPAAWTFDPSAPPPF